MRILINLTIKTKLKLNRPFVFKKINNKIAFTQDDIVVAIGIIKNPTSLEKTILIIKHHILRALLYIKQLYIIL